jgi:hypothetical protein
MYFMGSTHSGVLMKIFCKTLVLVSFFASISFAWDGERKGFLLGTGIGTSSLGLGYFDSDNTGDHVGSQMLLASTHTRIGYAFNNKSAVLLKLANHGVSYTTNTLAYQTWNSEKSQSTGKFIGLSILTYNPMSQTYFEVDPPSLQKGAGLTGGWLFEFAPHTDFEVSATIGGLNTRTYIRNVTTNSWNIGPERPTMFVAISMSVNILGY